MYQISVENRRGERLELNNSSYYTTATGLSPMKSDIITGTVANYGGARYISSRQGVRNIVLTIYVNTPVESNRINLYKYIKSRDWIRVYYKNGSRDVYIDGYVESFEDDLFAQTQTAQVSIICPKPQFLNVSENDNVISPSIAMFSFPFYTSDVHGAVLSRFAPDDSTLISNSSDDEVGFVYAMHCGDLVVNPMIYLEETGDKFKINRAFPKGSTIVINTHNGEKSVTYNWNGSQTNIINDLDHASKWFKLQAGFNHIIQTAETGANSISSCLTYTNEYEGV